ncbi:MAG TPA: RagB/SusD family nutrient uptake outer membrane protein [Phnomibacter sp.]|nr:RagB/SusD family nutrient uptake outer membrane protein [Phnomibacter sp.]
MKKLHKLLLTACVGAAFLAGCNKTFDIKPEDHLDVTQAYQNVYDADAAVLGVYGKFMGLAEQYIVLNELRADLINYTENADEALRDISTHNVKLGNRYADPRPFYEVILNCNDVLENFQKMSDEKKMTDDQFKQRYSDIAALRSFLYLQLGIHFGEVPYITSSLKDVNQIKNAANFPRLPFNVLLDSLINATEKIPFKELYPTGTNLNVTVDGYPTQKFFINKKVVLGDLYLWKGDYVKSASWYREVMETASSDAFGENYFSQYRIGGWGNGLNGHRLFYSRPGDATTLVYTEGWRMMFEVDYNTDGFRREWVWALPFDSRFKPGNPFINLFSPTGGSYLLKPSKEVYDLWDSEKQFDVQGNGLPYDARKLFSTANIGGQPVVMKFLYNYINWSSLVPANPFAKTGKWFLFRQSQLHMRFCEAANRAGRHKLAWGLLNNGIAGAFPAPTSDVTNYHNTLWDSYPFNFDARNSGGSGVPYYRADWYRNTGIRGRANVVNIAIPNPADSLISMENALLKEEALENAFEGTRWPDMLRIALRRNEPAIIADKVYNKLLKDGNGNAAAVRAKLMSPANWYLPFNW